MIEEDVPLNVAIRKLEIRKSKKIFETVDTPIEIAARKLKELQQKEKIIAEEIHYLLKNFKYL